MHLLKVNHAVVAVKVIGLSLHQNFQIKQKITAIPEIVRPFPPFSSTNCGVEGARLYSADLGV